MNDVQRNFLTAGIVCAASAALIGGMAMRERVDERASGLGLSSSLAPSLVASRETRTAVADERYFYDLLVLLKTEYVDPIPSELPLAVGSVKGMVSSLDDEQSLYMSKNLFPAFVKSLEGRYEGIGAGLALRRSGSGGKAQIRTSLDLLARIPVLRVTLVAPDSPAAKAGVLPGDEIERVDGRWVVNPEIVARYRAIDAKVSKKELPESAKVEIQNELREKFKNSMMPMRALEKLSTGSTGEVQLEWRRKGKVFRGTLTKATTQVEVDEVNGQGVFRPSFTDRTSSQMKEALAAGKLKWIDLRGIEHGNVNEMRDCLSILGPAGVYGQVVKDNGSAEPIRVAKGATSSKTVRILVDGNTGGVAEAFVLALKSKGLATVQGGTTAGRPWIVERTALPDGSGFTLRIGKFKTAGGKA